MAGQLEHRKVQQIMSSLEEAKIVNLDARIRDLMEPMAPHLKDIGGEVSLHVLCCNEYFLVTGLTGVNIAEIRENAAAIRSAIERGR